MPTSGTSHVRVREVLGTSGTTDRLPADTCGRIGHVEKGSVT
jgi:hypothetical protein